MWQYNSKTISVGRSWTDDNGVTHPAVWNRWTSEQKTAMGLVWVDDPVVEPYDDRFYYSANNPKSLEDSPTVDQDNNPVLDENGEQIIQIGLKSTWLSKTKLTAHSYLSSTDWYAARAFETGEAIPQNIADYRNSVRAASNTIETAINNCTTLEEVIALFDVPTDADGNVTGKAVINNWP